MSRRWTRQAVEIKPGLPGAVEKDAIQAELDRPGVQGWEMVAMVHASPSTPS